MARPPGRGKVGDGKAGVPLAASIAQRLCVDRVPATARVV